MSNKAPRRAIVIGAGVAGCFAAHFLAEYGFEVAVLDENGVAGGASGNHSGLAHPALSVDDNRLSQLTRQGFFFALQVFKKFPELVQECGIFHLALDSESREKMQKIAKNGILPPENLEFFDAIPEFQNHFGALFYKNGALARPAELCKTLLKNPKITFFPLQFKGLEILENGLWQVAPEIPAAPVVVLALGNRLPEFVPEIALIPARGQVHFGEIDDSKMSPTHAMISRKGYIVPLFADKITAGASFVLGDSATDFRESDQAEILGNLAAFFPPIKNVQKWSARAAIRAMSPDRLPVAGVLPEIAVARLLKNSAEIAQNHGIFCLGGFGARGLIWAPFLADFLASQIAGLSSPLPLWAKKALSPARFF